MWICYKRQCCLWAWCPACHPTNSIKPLKETLFLFETEVESKSSWHYLQYIQCDSLFTVPHNSERFVSCALISISIAVDGSKIPRSLVAYFANAVCVMYVECRSRIKWRIWTFHRLVIPWTLVWQLRPIHIGWTGATHSRLSHIRCLRTSINRIIFLATLFTLIFFLHLSWHLHWLPKFVLMYWCWYNNIVVDCYRVFSLY